MMHLQRMYIYNEGKLLKYQDKERIFLHDLECFPYCRLCAGCVLFVLFRENTFPDQPLMVLFVTTSAIVIFIHYHGNSASGLQEYITATNKMNSKLMERRN